MKRSCIAFTTSLLVLVPSLGCPTDSDIEDSAADTEPGSSGGATESTESMGSAGTDDTAGSDSGTSCNPGDLRECECSGVPGTQVCRPEGDGYYPCFCGDDPGSTGAGGSTGVDDTEGDSDVDTDDEPVGNVPLPQIAHPGDGETRVVGVPIPCVGSAFDVEDGELSGAALVWSSDIDGVLGTGTSIEAVLTTVGQHELILSATDSDANVGTASLTLMMVAE